MALSDATVGPSVNSPPRGMTSENEVWIEVFLILGWYRFGGSWVYVWIFATNRRQGVVVRV